MTVDAASIADGVAMPEDKTKSGDKLAAWSVFALILGLAGDMAKPLGNYSLWLTVIGIAAFALCFALRRHRHARRAMFHTGVFSVIMGAIVVLQYVAPAEKDAEQRGIAAAFVPFVASVQTKVLPLPENQKLLLVFQDSIARGSDSERVATARELYSGVEDPAIRRAMLETMMASENSALQQSAILMRLAERKGDNLSLPPTKRDSSDLLSRRLLSYSFRVSHVDVDSGALRLAAGGAGSDGTVSRQGITMQLYIDFETTRRRAMLVDLKPDKDMRLSGTARLDSGESAAVELPLF